MNERIENMAVTIVNSGKRLDWFETKCPHCGTELTYARYDVQAHVRWKNGFVYCPSCRNPVGHEEEKMCQTEEEYIASIPEGIARKYQSQLKVFRILRNIFIPVGLVLMIVLTIVLSAIYSQDQVKYDGLLFWIGFSFLFGLSLLIAAGVFKRMIRNRRAYDW